LHPQFSKEGPYESYLAYNRKKTAAVAALQTTFNTAHSIAYGTLSHSHLLLLLRCMSSGARWYIKETSQYAGLRKLQDPQGRWTLPAVAAKDQNFYELIHTGLRMEVSSWKILVEDPGGLLELVSCTVSEVQGGRPHGRLQHVLLQGHPRVPQLRSLHRLGGVVPMDK
jgi:hypothetical protein